MVSFIGKLTVCIPTYNRCVELQQALGSIQKELGSNVHVVVSDNASNDGTNELCEEYERENYFKTFLYYRASNNSGADQNFLKVVSLANTEYCLILGSDDAFMPRSKKLVEMAIERGDDLSIFSRALYDNKLKRQLSVQSFWSRNVRESYNVSNTQEFTSYVKECVSLAGAFSYLSCFMFRRDVWVETNRVRGFVGSAYSHVAALLEGISERDRTILRVYSEPLVKCRMGNDSFLDGGALKRFEIDWDGYEALAATFYPDSEQSLLDILKRNNRFRDLLALRFHLIEVDDLRGLIAVKKRLAGASWGRIPLLKWRVAQLFPGSLISLLRVLFGR